MPFGFGQMREVTVVNDETERAIPLRTFWNCIGLSALDIVFLFLSGFMVARQIHNIVHPFTIRIRWAPWVESAINAFLMIWPIMIALICWSAIAWSYPILYRFFVETFGKNAQPIVDKWNPENGIWSPFYKKPPAPDKPQERKPRYLIFNGEKGEE